MTVMQYIDWYRGQYGKRPSEKLIASFCKVNKVTMEQLEKPGEDFWQDERHTDLPKVVMVVQK